MGWGPSLGFGSPTSTESNFMDSEYAENGRPLKPRVIIEKERLQAEGKSTCPNCKYYKRVSENKGKGKLRNAATLWEYAHSEEQLVEMGDCHYNPPPWGTVFHDDFCSKFTPSA